ncbi:hypothetical protein LINGRAHAP2_LOCUS14108 [Linum grandiflorum]
MFSLLCISSEIELPMGTRWTVKISDLQNGYFLVRFKSKRDYEWTIDGGPWMFGETYLTVHQWTKNFNPWTTEVKTTMSWVQLPDLPIKFFNPVAVKRIASRIQRLVRVDRAMEEGARDKYAMKKIPYFLLGFTWIMYYMWPV